MQWVLFLAFTTVLLPSTSNAREQDMPYYNSGRQRQKITVLKSLLRGRINLYFAGQFVTWISMYTDVYTNVYSVGCLCGYDFVTIR